MRLFDRIKRRLKRGRLPDTDADAQNLACKIDALRKQYPDSFGAQYLDTISNGFDDVISTPEAAAEQERRWKEIQGQRTESSRKAS